MSIYLVKFIENELSGNTFTTASSSTVQLTKEQFDEVVQLVKGLKKKK